MYRTFVITAGLLLVAAPGQAQDTSPEAIIAAVKRATTYIQVEGSGWKGSGSGFVVTSDRDTAIIATNYHVLAGPDMDHEVHRAPTEILRIARSATATVVFDSGTKQEQSIKAEVIAADSERDLAILKVTGVKDLPAPIKYARLKLIETTPVITFGFPFGNALASSKTSAPAVTVGKASISSLRTDDEGELSIIQIDGNLNPGNSGGPVVDEKGQLVGIAVATLKNGQGIGFVIPAIELERVMRGRLSDVHVTTRKLLDGKIAVKAEVGVIDPDRAIRGVTIHYVAAAKGVKPNRGEPISKYGATQTARLKVENGIATGEVLVDASDGEILVQAVPDGGSPHGASTLVANFSMGAFGGSPAVANQPPAMEAKDRPKPPAGWKEFVPKDNSFVVFVPEKTSHFGERERTLASGQLRLRITDVHFETPDGLTYLVEKFGLPVQLARGLKNKEKEELFREVALSRTNGTIAGQSDVKVGPYSGKEYRMDLPGGGEGRVRIIVPGVRVFSVYVLGPKDAMAKADTGVFLNSLHIPVVVPKQPGPGPGPGPGPFNPGPNVAADPNRRWNEVQGGGDNFFKDAAPKDGVLVGLEIGLGKFFDNDVIHSIRPVYLTGQQESVGQQFGKELTRVVKVVAKPGYAVGGITTKTGLGLDGMAITFMKMADGKLDPNDSYQSEWIGGQGGGGPVNAGGDGSLVLGLLIKTNNDNDVCGIGLPFGPVKIVPGKKTAIPTGGGDPEFDDCAPEGGLLVGLEFGLDKFFDNDVIKTVQPIFQVGETQSAGTQHGVVFKGKVKVVAKPGYAVGAITCKTGLGIDGLSVIFMKISGTRLDPTDSYQSQWIGGQGGGPPTKYGGDGTPVIGIIGKKNRNRELTGLGLMLAPGQAPPPVQRPGPGPAPAQNDLVGKLTATQWVHGGIWVYEFKKDGTFILVGTKRNGTYTISPDGSQITIRWVGERRADETIQVDPNSDRWKMSNQMFVPRQ